jgi:uncharacterized cupin superfamily protein
MVVHWDDVPEQERAFGDMRATRQLLAKAAGATAIGCSRWRIGPGARNAPVHVHADEEEIFYVLEGTGAVWQDGRAYAVSTGDAIVFPAGEAAHTLFGGPIDVLAFGSGSDTSLTWLPRANVMWAAPRWLPLDGPIPFEAEAALGPLELPEPVDPADERPSWIVGLTDVEAMPVQRGRTNVVRTKLGVAAGSRRSGLQHVVIAPGAESHPPHVHTLEEELFVVLGGSGRLRLGDEELGVRAGTVVSRPPGSGVAHSYVADADGLTMLAYGQRNPGDVVFYPRSNKVRMRGVPVSFIVDQVDYWDGEE